MEELNGIRGRKWNAKQVIIFQTTILQHVRRVTGAQNIRARIDARLDSWNIEAFNELVCDFYATAMGSLGMAHSNQNYDQRQRKVLNLVLCGKLRKAIIFVCKQELGGGGGGYPTKVSNITCVIDETSTTVLEGKHLHKINPPVLCWKCTTKKILLFSWILRRIWSNRLHKNV